MRGHIGGSHRALPARRARGLVADYRVRNTHFVPCGVTQQDDSVEEELDSGEEDEEVRAALEKHVGGSARSRRHRASVTYKEEDDDVGVVSDEHEEDAASELGENTEGDAASVEEGEEGEDMQVVNGKRMSKYEAERLAKIARNQGILQQLGLAASKIAQGVCVCVRPGPKLTPFPSSPPHCFCFE